MNPNQSFLPGKQYIFTSKAMPEESFSVVNFTGTEGLSRLYEYEITLVFWQPRN